MEQSKDLGELVNLIRQQNKMIAHLGLIVSRISLIALIVLLLVIIDLVVRILF